MRCVYAALAVLLAAGCGGQTTDTCVMKVDVADVPAITLGSTQTVHAQLGTKTGNCPSPLKGQLEWSSVNSPVLQLLATTDSTATVKGLKAGTSVLQVWLRTSPAIRDSTIVQVTAPVDTAK